MLVGGILTGAAFFLPFYLSTPNSSLFGPGRSQFDYNYVAHLGSFIQNYSWISSGGPLNTLTALAADALELVSELLLISAGLLAFKLRRAPYIWGLSGALLSLTHLLWDFTANYAPIHISELGPNALVWEFRYNFGIGFWLAVIGSAVGLVGALLGWLQQPSPAAPPAQPTGGPAFRVKPGAILVLCGGLAGAASFFIPAAAVPHSLLFVGSLFDTSRQPNGYFAVWPDLLAVLLLLVSGLLALTGRQRAYLASLSGALVGLTFFLFYPSLLLLIGWVLGLVGAALGLRGRPATASSSAAVPETPAP